MMCLGSYRSRTTFLFSTCGSDVRLLKWRFILIPPTLSKLEVPISTLYVDLRSWCPPLQVINITHYDDVIMGAMASQITSLTIIYSIVYSDADQRKHQSSASLAFVWGIHRWIPRTNGQWRGKCLHLMTSSWSADPVCICDPVITVYADGLASNDAR